MVPQENGECVLGLGSENEALTAGIFESWGLFRESYFGRNEKLKVNKFKH